MPTKDQRRAPRPALPKFELREQPERGGLLGRGLRFFTKDVWAPAAAGDAAWRKASSRVARIVYLTARGFVADNCIFRASALTYITVLSLVPLLAFSFSVVKGFGFYDRFVERTITPFLDASFGPLVREGPMLQSEGAHEMRMAIERLLEFVNRTDVSSLGVLGLVLLVYTVVKLLGTIERSFNDIWGVQKSRSVLRKVSDYLTMVIVTPIFLLAATALTTAAQNSFVVEFLRKELGLGAAIEVLLRFMPLLAMWVGFTFIYLALPNAKTRLSSAVLGALVGGTLWQLTLVLHLKFQIGIARYNAIYSSFAALPIFLMWINVSWITVLLGAEVCFAHQSEPGYLRIARSRPSDHAFKELVGLRALARIGQRFLRGAQPYTAEELSTELSVPLRLLDEVLYKLVEHGMLAETSADKDVAFLPARDLEAITVKSVLDALKGTAGPVDLASRSDVDHHLDHLLVGLDEELAQSRFNRTLKSLAEASLRETTAAADAQTAADTQAEADPARSWSTRPTG